MILRDGETLGRKEQAGVKHGRGGQARQKKERVGPEWMGEGHRLLFCFVHQMELGKPDMTGTVHQFNEKPIIHSAIPSKMDFFICLSRRNLAEFFLKQRGRDRLALNGDGALGIHGNQNHLGDGIRLASGGRKFDLQGGEGEGRGEHEKNKKQKDHIDERGHIDRGGDSFGAVKHGVTG